MRHQITIIFTLFLITLTSSIYCTECIWNGNAGDHDWDNPANWINGIPMVGDTANISSDSVIISSTSTIKHLRLTNHASLRITNALGLISSSGVGIICINSIIYNEGTLEVSSAQFGISLIDTSTINNYNSASLQVLFSVTTPIHISINSKIRNQSGSNITVDFSGSSLTNYGEIDNRGSFNINNATAESLNNSGTLSNLGELNIDGAGATGISNADSLYNASTAKITIKNVPSGFGIDGFKNASNAIVLNYGKIDLSDSPGIFNSGIFNNNDSIIATNISGSGITNSEIFKNYQGSSILIEMASTGIYSCELFINEGKIEINNSSNNGLDNCNYFYNIDTLIINNTAHIAISSEADLDNHQNGYIEINTTLDNSKPAIEHSSGTINNYGKLFITSTADDGIFNESIINNYDSLIILSTSGVAIRNEDSLYNDLDGHIIISSSYSAMSNLGRLHNHGDINITSCAYGLNNSSLLHNYDSLYLYNITDEGITNSDTIYNFVDASIEIDFALGGGFINSNSQSYLLNQGTLNLKSIDKIIFKNYGIIQNEADISLMGIGPDFSDPDGLSCEGNSIFTNTINSTLNISNIVGDGIPIEIKLGAEFTCDGTLDVETN